MRYIAILSLAVSAALLPLGCEPNGTGKIKDAVDATVEAAKAKRDEYARDMSKQLDDLNAKYAALKDRADKATGAEKKDLEKKLEEAKVKRDAATQKLEELKQAGADRWEKVKDGVGSAFDDLKKVLE